MDAKRILIKKYENRRLYDSTNSRYVNLDDIAQMVREGADVQVIDAANGDDLTRVVLAQIIMESAKTPNSSFPIDVLKQMVIASGYAGKDGFMNYMRTFGEMYSNAYRVMNPSLMPFELFRKPTAAPTSTPANPTEPADANQAHLRELQQRIEELERWLERPAATRQKGKKKSGPKRKR